MEEISSGFLGKLTYKLSGQVTGPLYIDYNNKRREIERIWAKPDNAYSMLQDYASTVDALLAMSLFYRHMLGHIHGASSFYAFVNRGTTIVDECAIKVGNSVIDKDQQGHLQAALIRFDQILRGFQIGTWFFEFSETVEFLRNCKELLSTPEYEIDDTI